MNLIPDAWRDMDRPFEGLLMNQPRLFRSWRPLLRQLDEFLDDASRSFQDLASENLTMPKLEVEEGKDHYVLTIDMPGLKKSEISVDVQGNQLVIFGESQQVSKQDNGEKQTSERRTRRYERRMSLPTGIKAEQIEAQFEDGVLSILVPKGADQRQQSIKIGEGKGSIFIKLLGDRSKKEGVPTSSRKGEEQASAH